MQDIIAIAALVVALIGLVIDHEALRRTPRPKKVKEPHAPVCLTILSATIHRPRDLY